mmetsp:Transcript_108770/g.307525  ORF Transcript_108770/g.307525 Transcript_108770/m.307525 type:complete len:432 (+) Transcript_108770:287-1582(+)
MGLGEMLRQHLLEPLCAQLCHPKHVVGSAIVEALRLVGIVRCDYDRRLGPDLAGDLQEMSVGGAYEEAVGDRGNDDPGLTVLLLCVLEHVGRRRVSVAALDPLFFELTHDVLVDIDDVNPLQDLWVPHLELRNEHGRDLLEAQENNVALFLFALLVLSVVVPLYFWPAHTAIHTHPQKLEDAGVETDEVRRRNREDGKGPDDDGHRVRIHVAKAYPEAANDQGKLADLRQVDRGNGREPWPAPHNADNSKDAQPPEGQHNNGHEDALENGARRRHRDLHAQSGEEERDEEVPDVLDLSVELRAVGVGGDGDAGNQGRELHGESDERQYCRAADEEAPGQRQHEHELDALGRIEKHGRHYELCVCHGYADEDRNHGECADDAEDLRVRQFWLDGEHDDRPDVLEDEDADREAAGLRAHLALLAEDLRDNHRR